MKAQVYEIAALGTYLVAAGAVQVACYFVLNSGGTYRELVALFSIVVACQLLNFDYVTPNQVALVAFIVSCFTQLVALAKAPKVVEERHADIHQLANKTESCLHWCACLLWISWAILNGHRAFAITMIPCLLGSQM